jgi:hypothetical protein
VNELDTALYNRLTGGTALTALLAGTASVYNQIAPEGAALPYALYQLAAGGDENETPMRSKQLVYNIKGVSATGAKSAGQIDNAIDDLLHRVTLTVTGWTDILTKREGDFAYTETTPEGRHFWHSGGRYRLWLYES